MRGTLGALALEARTMQGLSVGRRRFRLGLGDQKKFLTTDLRARGREREEEGGQNGLEEGREEGTESDVMGAKP